MSGREYTEEEIRKQFLDGCRESIRFWLGPLSGSEENYSHDAEVIRRIEGAVFGILVMIDGEGGMPGFILAPDPHPDDKAYHKKNGTNWYPENHKVAQTVKGDIAGQLHDEFNE